MIKGSFFTHKNNPNKEFEEKVIQINRVTKKTKGGNKLGFTALVVVGDKKGRVGVALGKANDVLSAIKKGIRLAKKNFIKVPLFRNRTIPHETMVKFGGAKVLLRPAPLGTGVIAGGSVRAVVEAAGIQNIVSKILGSNNKINNVYATFYALKGLFSQPRITRVNPLLPQAGKTALKKGGKNAAQPIT